VKLALKPLPLPRVEPCSDCQERKCEKQNRQHDDAKHYSCRYPDRLDPPGLILWQGFSV
jgi:hypothetical protein